MSDAPTAQDTFNAIDLDRYPIDRPGTPAYGALLAGIHADLAARGCAHLKGFVKPDAAQRLAAEGDAVAQHAHRSYNRVNPYFTQDDPAYPIGHPRRRFEDRSNAFVPADNFGADSLLRAIYETPAFTDFVREALGEKEGSFFRYDDPLADVIINVTDPGGGFPWHFDTNTYTVTLGIQPGDGGGAFQYSPFVRSEDGENYDGVAAVMDGTSDSIETLVLEPGDLQLFLGRYTLHRVTAVEGTLPRYVGIYSYGHEPHMCGRVERTRQLYGRVLPIHMERDQLARGDQLAD